MGASLALFKHVRFGSSDGGALDPLGDLVGAGDGAPRCIRSGSGGGGGGGGSGGVGIVMMGTGAGKGVLLLLIHYGRRGDWRWGIGGGC